MKKNNIQGFIFIGLVSVMIGASTTSYAQTKQVKIGTQYGFQISGGFQSFQLASNLVALNQLTVGQRGGSLSFMVGQGYWKAKISPLGLYHSSTNSPVATKLIESGAQINIYPIKIFSKATSSIPQLYFSGGATRGKYKINGSTLTEGESSLICIYDTFSTSIVSWNIVGGAGVEYQIGNGQEFITVFAEIKKALSAGTSSYQEEFMNTSFKNFTMINVGFSIGFNP